MPEVTTESTKTELEVELDNLFEEIWEELSK